MKRLKSMAVVVMLVCVAAVSTGCPPEYEPGQEQKSLELFEASDVLTLL